MGTDVTETPVILAFDTASPEASVAVSTADRVLAMVTLPQRQTAEGLLVAIAATLAEALGTGGEDGDASQQPSISGALTAAGASELGDRSSPIRAPVPLHRRLAGVVALAGPGSFTGLRIGFATALALHRGAGLPPSAPSTLQILAAAAHLGVPVDARTGELVAAVDALHGAWFVQRFSWPADDPTTLYLPSPLDAPRRLDPPELAALPPGLVIGHRVVDSPSLAASRLRPHAAPPLAGIAARLAAADQLLWSADALRRPLYLAPPNATLPRGHAGSQA